MVKTIRLTWGFSLCKLKVPAVVLENGKFGLSSIASGPPNGHLSQKYHDQEIGYLSNPLYSSAKNIRQRFICISKSGVPVRNNRKKSRDDIELSVVVSPPELASRYSSSAHDPNISDTRTRIFVYLVSVALSLAALSIVKLHKLLEWLLADADTAKLKENVLKVNKRSVFIAEILKAVALRFSSMAAESPETFASSPASAINVTSPVFSLQTCKTSKPTVTHHAFTTPAPPTPEKPRRKCGFCYHLGGANGEPCLLCLLATDSLNDVANIDQTFQHVFRRCQSDYGSKQTKSKDQNLYGWAPPTRLNAGVSRAQVGPSSLSLSHLFGLQLATAVEEEKESNVLRRMPRSARSFCFSPLSTPLPPQVPDSESEESRVKEMYSGSPPLFHRSPKLVACVAPTSQQSDTGSLTETAGAKSPSSPVRPRLSPLRVFRDGSLYLAALQHENEHDEVECLGKQQDSAFEQAKLALSSLGSARILRRAPSPSAVPKILQSRSSSPLAHASRDVALSPICDLSTTKEELSEAVDDEENEFSDSGEMELDEDAVWLTGDFYATAPDVLETDDYEDDDELEKIFSNYFSDNVDGNRTGFSTYPRRRQHSCYRETSSAESKYRARSRSCGEDLKAPNGGPLSDLVALTTSIGDDLVRLETGYRDLLSRVHANGLELDKANNRLGFVWHSKDNIQLRRSTHYEAASRVDVSTSPSCDESNDHNPPVSSIITSPALVEDSVTSSTEELAPARRETPLGRSFHSDYTESRKSDCKACCGCECHQQHHEHRHSYFEGCDDEDETTLMEQVTKWRASLIERLPPSSVTDALALPDDFEDEYAVQ